ncbi:Fibronectin type III,RING-type zinc-finger, LisH dimerisation motif,Zinc finger, RING-type,B-box, C- [Cinara cedri]|uniref:Fibronectin type III,RING-type zinc-finger, LisH dimerisation motif,Zinc finger, RING-type,B-box, C n=1 Tax=Cinara cedri TaxID=506608 RepID=A0A5E4N2F3_9HEMI|nr:Fibronectin type III,RING-type zinc-finger, LisH dimerisation motif,Zinc finger, RING-type,B-box, C- [Cinara cedri]
MEDELHCAACKQLFNNPVLLPCYHALCLNCAVHMQRPLEPAAPQENSGNSTTSSSNESHISDYHPESDKLSILSETDSGVVCNSRPNSYVGTPNINGIVFPPVTAGSYSLSCPACKKTVYFDDNGAHNLPKYRTMRNIVDRYGELRHIIPKCQLCECEPAADATVLCEQCEVLYCDSCRENCHPSRGPLAKHNLLEPSVGKVALRNKIRNRDIICSEHEEECLSMYCMVCKTPVCAVCMHDSRHSSHDVQAINTMCKAQKTELSLNLQQLSEKARTTTEFIQRLKQMSEKLNGECEELERQVDARCDALIRSIERRRQWLIDAVRQDKETKQRSLKEHVASCTCKLQKTTSLLQFCIEALKENDPVSFLQVGSMLIARVSNTDMTWHKDVLPSPRSYHQLDLTLDDNTVLKAIEHMNFIQMKTVRNGEDMKTTAPSAALIITEECSAENNSVTIAWQPPASSYVEGYVLELDDGNGGDFREVYCGTETICTVDGLHFNCTYNARVKAFNTAGEGEYSEIIGLQTSEVAWFTFDPCLSSPELCFTPDNMTVTCEGFEHRVALGSVGFSRGVHYWEFTVDRYDADTDPSFGIARLDVSKEEMLGKDESGWSMYIDKQRSWFMHCRSHEQRCEGGIQVGSTIGVLLDLNKHQLSFFVNDEPQGPVAFHGLYGVFYPAVSVNRGVAVTLHTALDAPSDVEDC